MSNNLTSERQRFAHQIADLLPHVYDVCNVCDGKGGQGWLDCRECNRTGVKQKYGVRMTDEDRDKLSSLMEEEGGPE